jgi:hypothetical protein
VVASLIVTCLVILVTGLAGQWVLGAGVGTGIVLGSLNGFLIQFVLDRGAPILATSFLRLMMLTLLALLTARLLGGVVWPVVVGIAVAQLVMVGVGVRQGRLA